MTLLENALERCVPGLSNDGRLTEAMRYSLLGGGKRIRGRLVMLFCQLHGGCDETALPLACAIETVHAHSLIHDDLPCMDDDDLRRGKPSCHVSYGEATALLAGDALLNRAYGVIADSVALTDGQKVRAVSVLSACTGENGMLGGQQLDKLYETLPADETILDEIQDKKTGALIRAACELGCIAAGVTDETDLAAARTYGTALGRAFQILDDILDVTSTSEVLGKPVKSDEELKKSTYVSVLGLDAAKEKAAELTKQALAAVERYGDNASELTALARSLMERKN